MAFVMEIAFDNSRRLARKRYLFEYQGIRFKLVQDNPRRWADHLITILPTNDQSSQSRAFSVASEFLSALAWQNGACVMLWQAGGRGWPDDIPLEKTAPTVFSLPRGPYRGPVTGYDISRVPHIRTSAQRVALSLFREANASNNDYLAFLFFWQVLEVDGGDPHSFINNMYRRRPRGLWLDKYDLDNLPLAGRSLGAYLQEDCRHAIAHIRRQPGRKVLNLDARDERVRLAISTRIVRAFADYFIRNAILLNEQLYLFRRGRTGFPVYVDEQALRAELYRPAYPPPKLGWPRRPRKRKAPRGESAAT